MKKFAIVVGILASSQGFSAEILSNHLLFGQAGSSISAQTLTDSQQLLGVSLDSLRGTRLLPNKAITGESQTIAATWQYGFRDQITFGSTLAIIKESLSDSHPDFNKNSNPHLQGEFFIKYKIWQNSNFATTLIPFFETGFAEQEHFSYGSKSRLGAILSSTYRHRIFEVTGNTHYRYRPAEVHSRYRIANDYGASLRANWLVNQHKVWLDVSRHNTSVLNINHAGSRYQDQASVATSLGSTLQIKQGSLEFAFSHNPNNDQLGTSKNRITLAFNTFLGSGDKVEAPPQPSPGLSPGKRIYWLDQLRKNMAQRNQKVGSELNGFTLNEKQPMTYKPSPRPAEDIKAADEEIKKLQSVDKRISNKKPKSEATAKSNPTPSVKKPAQLPVSTDI